MHLACPKRSFLLLRQVGPRHGGLAVVQLLLEPGNREHHALELPDSHEHEDGFQPLLAVNNVVAIVGAHNLAMNKGVLQVARQFIHGTKIEEPMLNRVEAVIRAFDPCLSCSTHAVGQMALQVQLLAPDGEVVDEVRRG